MANLPLWSTFSQGIGMVAVMAFLLELVWKRPTIHLPPELILFGIFVVYTFVGAFFAAELPVFIGRQATLVQLWVLTVVLYNVLTRNYMGHWAGLRAMQLGVIVTSAVSSIWFGGEASRLAGTLGNANDYGRMMLFGFLVTLILPVRNGLGRTIQAAALAFLTIQIVLSGSRQAMLGLFVLAGLYTVMLVLYRSGRPLRALGIVLVLVIAGSAFFHWVQDTAHWHRVENLVLFLRGEEVREGSVYARLDFVKAGIAIWTDHPLLGVGTDQYRIYAERLGLARTYSHANAIEILVNFGILGFLLYYGIYILLTWRMLTSVRRWWKVPRYRLLLGVLVGFWFVWMGLEVASVNYYDKLHWIIVVFLLSTTYNLGNPRSWRGSVGSTAVCGNVNT